MGDWGPQVWETDEASDWFSLFWKKCDFSLLIDEIENFNPTNEYYESVRAACYLLQVLGIVHVWPGEHQDKLKPLLNKAIIILTNMIEPPNEDWCYLEMFGNTPDPDVINNIKEQIELLKKREQDILF